MSGPAGTSAAHWGSTLFALFKKPLLAHTQTGLALDERGAGLAQVERPSSGPPRLLACEWRAWRPEAGPAETLAALGSHHGMARTRVNTVVASGDYQLLLVEAPEVPPAELRAAVRWRIKDLLDFHLDDAVIDVFEIPEQSRRAQGKMLYAVAARSTVVQRHVDLVLDQGAELNAIDIPELALRNVTALLPGDERGLALLHLHGDHGTVVLTRQGVLYLARRIEIGVAALAAEIATGLGQSQVAATISLEVQRSLDYFESHYDQRPVGELVVCADSSVLQPLTSFLTTDLAMTVAPLDLADVLAGEVEPDTLVACLPALGAALREDRATP